MNLASLERKMYSSPIIIKAGSILFLIHHYYLKPMKIANHLVHCEFGGVCVELKFPTLCILFSLAYITQ
jgi:hypothetical protein